ncbi:unnamed protein product [Nyctereutes procyonoides]|uniref:(raccoon dog) hypothetical protein n=1 Tax=Nyctereutes procyonoides TaxID=34880 RepID=A0A811ZUJ6_NYCPR|nr:unnamed protein product [Nyctereutes procyonoides]
MWASASPRGQHPQHPGAPAARPPGRGQRAAARYATRTESAWSWTAALAGFGVVQEVTKQSEALLILRARSSCRGRGAAPGDSLLPTYIPTIGRVDVTSQVHQTRTLPPLHHLPPWPRHQSPLTGMTPEASSPACLLDPHAGKANSQDKNLGVDAHFVVFMKNGIMGSLLFPSSLFPTTHVGVSRSTTLSQRGSSGAHRAAPCRRTGETFRWIVSLENILAHVFCTFWRPGFEPLSPGDVLVDEQPPVGERNWSSATERPRGFRIFCFSAKYTSRGGVAGRSLLRILLAAAASVATTTNLSRAVACGPQRRSSSSSHLTSQRSLAHAQDSGDPQKPRPPWRTPLLGSLQPRRPSGATGPGQG